MLWTGDANICKQATSAVSLRDAEWATYTTVLGFDVAGESENLKQWSDKWVLYALTLS